MNFIKVVRQGARWPTEFHAPGFSGGNTFCLPLPDVSALIFGNKGKHLQNDVAQESAHQIFATPGVQQWHVQHYDVDTFCLGEQSPLLQYFCVVASKTVDTLDIEQIVFFQFSHQPLVLRAVEVPAGLLIHEDVFLRNLQFSQCNQLPALVLVAGADTNITIDISQMLLLWFAAFLPCDW